MEKIKTFVKQHLMIIVYVTTILLFTFNIYLVTAVIAGYVFGKITKEQKARKESLTPTSNV